MADKSVSEYAESEVQKHASENDLWMIIDNGVYDVTKFIDEHPGGSDVLLEHAGTNATLAFEEVGHSADARVLLEKYKVGTVKAGSQKYCVRICVPDTKDSVRSKSDKTPADPAPTKSVTSAPSRTKSVVSTPSRTRCLSCCRAPTVCEPSRSKTALEQSRTKSATSHRSPSQFTQRAVSAKPGPYVDAAKAKPTAAVKPTSYTETTRMRPAVSPKKSCHTEPSRTQSVANNVSSRHKECFTQPPVPWRTKSSINQGQRTPPPRSRPVTPPSETPSSAHLCTAPSDRCKSPTCSTSRIPKSKTDLKSEMGKKPETKLETQSDTKPEMQTGPTPERVTTPEPDPFAPPEETSAYSDVWKYALVAIAGALVVTIVLKKMGKI